ncbi:aldo/keto reductase [Chromohalobacter israelensis]|uniref:Aldo/keto reductase n=1 Tax=Chromohalobacter israelensis (strain ATCC BAA-138 / DSM 3043 / CIP 106854 / NCIMB 13768 / 1H11) TaxID=290398 RepID=Q1R0L3_CHRI1|nr:aldo/keto reductase [Chromohalobacter salexigens]ABE57745.1 aldo/keto reductase [Chromohalobacter salexigens DSM 3043]
MEYRHLGQSGLRVSSLTLGTMTFGGVGKMASVGETDLAGAKRQVDMATERGVNFFDTANMYSEGRSEEILGEVLADRRESVLVASKVRFPMGDGPNDEGLSRHHILRQCEASLRRLRTDWLDLYLMHQWDGSTPLEETLATMDQLVRDGKIRYYGVSNWSAWHVMKALQVCERHDFIKPICQQIHYTAQARDAEYELMPAAVDQGLGTMVWSPLAGGLLSGKYRRDQRHLDGTRFSQGWTEPPIHDEDRLFDLIDVLVEVADGHGVSAAQVALAWTLTRPGVSTAVIGARKDEQLKDNLASAELTLGPDEIAAIEKVSRPALLYPYWHQHNTASSRLGHADRVLHAAYLDD